VDEAVQEMIVRKRIAPPHEMAIRSHRPAKD
jgi:hypothetical protein